ncbi:OTU domain-containing protein 4 [Chanos chanos]|uniref:ubiquitinyl hydrolase 1 n=1 Tax=Chanos chanos TaxID=29144 RepID=A0A6J2VHM6_CHACN|nr:OTU domain-containing protein 4 [Chanos chanos]
MEVRSSNMQTNDDREHEKLMDEHLKANGFYRKKIAKDGSCLFRAVAEQVLHCQGLHTKVRAACVNYLRQNRDLYESFIEGDFEEYLERLQDPQSWVGQVEITALAELYKHDFVIYQQPGQPPVNITENGFTDKVRLCFLNGNHYDSVYPASFPTSSAICQSILYELLYERVFGVDHKVLASCLKRGKEKDEEAETKECKSSDESDIEEEDEFWKETEGRSNETAGRAANTNSRQPYKGRERGPSRGGRDAFSRKVEKSLNPCVFRNVEYDVWVSSVRAQQKRDFCMAAGLQYTVGDTCKVRLNGRSYSAYIEEVSPNNGPVTVYIEHLKKKHTLPLWDLCFPSEDRPSWSRVTERGRKHHVANVNGHTPSDWETKGGKKLSKSVSSAPQATAGLAPGNRVQKQHSWPPLASVEEQAGARNGTSRRVVDSVAAVGLSPKEEEEKVLLELLNRDEESFPALGASTQTAVEGGKRSSATHGEKRSSRKRSDQKEKGQETGTKESQVQPQKTFQRGEMGKHAKKGSVDQDHRSSPIIEEKSKPSPTPLPSLAGTPSQPSSAPVSTKPVPAPSQNAPSSTPPPLTQPNSVPVATPVASQTDSISVSTPVSSKTTQAPVAGTVPAEPAPAPSPGLSQIAPVSQASASVSSEALPSTAPSSVPAPAAPSLSFCAPVSYVVVSDRTKSDPPSSDPLSLKLTGTAAMCPVASSAPSTAVTSPAVSAPLTTVQTAAAVSTVSAVDATPPTCASPAQGVLSSAPVQASVPVTAFPVSVASSAPASLPMHTAAVSSPSLKPTPPPQTAHVPAPPDSQNAPIPVPPFQAPPVPPVSLPPIIPNSSEPHAAPGPAVGIATSVGSDYHSQPPAPNQPPFVSQILQDPLYPGFPQNDKGERIPTPPYSLQRTGEDLPNDVNVLRFFFNLGLRAYTCPMHAPASYLFHLQAHAMQSKMPTSTPSPYMPPSFPDNTIKRVIPSPSGSFVPESYSNMPMGSARVGNSPAGQFEPQGVVLSSPQAEPPTRVGYNPNTQTTPLHMPPRPNVPMPWPTLPQPGVFPGVYPPPHHVPPPQYPPPPLPPQCAPSGGQLYPPTSLGPQRLPLPHLMPPEMLNLPTQASKDFTLCGPMATAATTVESGQGDVQRSVLPAMEKVAWQPPTRSGDCKLGNVAMVMPTVDAQYGGPNPVAQSFSICLPPKEGSEPPSQFLAGRLVRDDGITSVLQSSSPGGPVIGLELSPAVSDIQSCSPAEDWESEVALHAADLRNGRSFHSRSFKGAGRHGQEDGRGFRRRGSRGRREYGQWGRMDYQSSHFRGQSGRGRMQSYNQHSRGREAGHTGGQFPM